ncbi:MAG TPA: hypothetical protein VD968_10345, partial [Pyrinomonadaceae bacterium]|nr:hypothetical protein [Pyrinomonadaceae bacterium]
LAFEPLERGPDVRHAHRDVVDAGAALFEEFGDGRALVRRLKQLDALALEVANKRRDPYTAVEEFMASA